jgi:hypothetical protein
MLSATMKNRLNYYRILQVQPDAVPEIINSSYRIMMRELKKHPDLGGSTDEAALLNEAHHVLSDPVQRAAYDNELFHQFIQSPRARAEKPVAWASCPICQCPLSQEAAPGDMCPRCRMPLPSDRPMEPTKLKGRSFERKTISDHIHYYAAWPGKAKQGRMIDFSPKGVRFIAGEALTVGSVLKISCKLFEASGKITHVNEEISVGKRCYSVGVCFFAVRFTESRGTFFSASA